MIPTTVVISCAGMGTRLGLGCTKALVEVDGKPLIVRQLEMLKECADVRVVVGYQFQNVIDVVRVYRNDVIFAFNHDYASTGTAASFTVGAKYSEGYVVSLDGDLLVAPDDFKSFLDYDGELICATTPSTDNPVYLSTEIRGGKEYVHGFSVERGDYEWSGLLKLRADKLLKGNRHVYQIAEQYLPIEMRLVNAQEIDTVEDYERAVQWIKNGYSGRK